MTSSMTTKLQPAQKENKMAKLFVAKDVSQKMDDLAFKAEDAVHSMKKMARQNGIDTRPYHGEMKAIFQKIHDLSETFVTKIKGIESAKATDDTKDFPTNRPNDNIKSSKEVTANWRKEAGGLEQWKDQNFGKLKELAKNSKLGSMHGLIFNDVNKNNPSVTIIGEDSMIAIEIDYKTGKLGNIFRHSGITKM